MYFSLKYITLLCNNLLNPSFSDKTQKYLLLIRCFGDYNKVITTINCEHSTTNFSRCKRLISDHFCVCSEDSSHHLNPYLLL